MDFTQLTLLAAFAFLLLNYFYNILFNKRSIRKPPEAGGSWPIIGHLHLLTGSQPAHKVLADMADKYGLMFRIRLGVHQVLVVSDSRVAKECFTTNDRALASRPKALASEIMGYNYAMFGLGQYGPYWRDIRKVVVLELLSNRSLDALRHVRELGVKSFTQDIYRAWITRDQNDYSDNYIKVDMKIWFAKHIMDVSIEMLFGQRCGKEGSQGATAMFRRFFNLLGESVVGDFLPWLRWLDIGGHKKAMKETAEEIDSMVEKWLQEHKRKRHVKSKEEEDFMDALLSRFESDKDVLKAGFDSDTVVKATCMAILSAATDTTAVTLVWAFSLVLNNYKVLEKIQAELDIYIGKERHPNLLDLNNLTYLQVVVKETLRLYPAGPLLIPHESIEDCVVNGYHVSKGTRLVVNASKIHRDISFWSDPDSFRPERFLSEHKDIDVKGNHFELIPFGSGRRMCPGVSLALQTVELTLASLIHGFDLKRICDEPIDMTESAGLTNMKATPLYVLLTPRLPSHLY